MIDSRVTPSGVNRSTCLPHHFRELPLDVLGLQHAYEHAKRLHAAIPVAPGMMGYRIFCVFRDEARSLDLPAHEGAYVIAGRHTACDLVLAAEPTIALRHLLVRSVLLADGAVALRVLDLQTTLSFHVDDGGPCRSIFAIGPIAIRLGPYAIVALPLDPHALPPQLPKPELVRAAAAPRVAPGGPYRAPALPGGDRVFRSSHITILPASRSMSDLAVAPRGYAKITLERPFGVAEVGLEEAELDSGVLIGRAEKCKDGGLRDLLDVSISRAHLLVLREDNVTSAFDLASTQGTFAYGTRIRRFHLRDSGTTLALGRTSAVHMRYASVTRSFASSHTR